MGVLRSATLGGGARVTKPHLALAGPMAVGKTTVGVLLARRWGVPFVDLDAMVGSPAEIFAAEGESGFRRRESAALREIAALGGGARHDVARQPGAETGGVMLALGGVLALGGGTLATEGNAALLDGWKVVVLMASEETLRARIGDGSGRPLAADWPERLAARMETWRSAGRWVWTDGMSPEEVAVAVELCC